MKKLLFVLTLVFSTNSYSINPEKHPIYAQMIKNRPNLDEKYALKVSNIIHKYSVKYDLPKKIFTAILMQESGYSLEAKGCYKGLIRVRFCEEVIEKIEDYIIKPHYIKCGKRWEEKKVCSDFGIGQIWYKTAYRYDFDISRLTEDLEYSIKAAATVLRDFKKAYKHRDPEHWWTRYNASSRVKRNIYRQLVERYL